MGVHGELNLASFCGVYCGGCAWFNRRWRRAAGELLDLMKAYPPMPFEGELPFDYGNFERGLRWLRDDRYACPSCRMGGGPPSCDIRECARGRKMEFCYQCVDFPCDKLRRVQKEHPDNIANIMRIREIGLERWIEEQAKKVRAGHDIHVEGA